MSASGAWRRCGDGQRPEHPGGLTLTNALDLFLPTWTVRGARPKLHISCQNPEKQPGPHACDIDAADWHARLEALDNREADAMVGAEGKKQALVSLRAEVG